MWRERQEAAQWTRWKAVERERQSTALALTVGGVVEEGGVFVSENRGQKVDIIGHFGETVFLSFFFVVVFRCPKIKEVVGGKPK